MCLQISQSINNTDNLALSGVLSLFRPFDYPYLLVVNLNVLIIALINITFCVDVHTFCNICINYLKN